MSLLRLPSVQLLPLKVAAPLNTFLLYLARFSIKGTHESSKAARCHKLLFDILPLYSTTFCTSPRPDCAVRLLLRVMSASEFSLRPTDQQDQTCSTTADRVMETCFPGMLPIVQSLVGRRNVDIEKSSRHPQRRSAFNGDYTLSADRKWLTGVFSEPCKATLRLVEDDMGGKTLVSLSTLEPATMYCERMRTNGTVSCEVRVGKEMRLMSVHGEPLFLRPRAAAAAGASHGDGPHGHLSGGLLADVGTQDAQDDPDIPLSEFFRLRPDA